MIKRILRHTFSLLNTDYVKLGEKWNYRNVISPYHRIYYIDDGFGELSDITKVQTLEPGYLYIIPSFTLCNLSCTDYLSQYFVQFFEESSDGISMFSNNRSIYKIKAKKSDVSNFERLIAINPGRGINRSDNPRIYEKQIFYNEYQELNNQQNLAFFLETQGILLQLVSRFAVPEVFKQKEVKYMPVNILECIRFILVSLNLPLSVTSLADRANLNPQYFSRLFQEHTGVRPLAYINEKRIERARYLIITSKLDFSEIATQTGFESLSHFSRTFKNICGVSPRDYKNKING